MGTIDHLLRKIVSFPILLYQIVISPMMRPRCRFYPSCSEYAICALRNYGIIKGLWMSLKRLLRCHPWSPGGYDPIHPFDEKL